MTDCSKQLTMFPSCKSRKITVNFQGGDITSDAGALLIRQADRKIQLISDIASQISDSRQKNKCTHELVSMIRQRVYGLALGYEDLNDHDNLRTDPCFQTALNEDKDLASSPTLCRLENRASREVAWAIHEVLVNKFIESFKKAPDELIMDFDATDDVVHGNQEGRFFHGYYRDYCFLPLYVLCGEQLLVSYLRTSSIGASKHAWAILALLVKRLRKAWPKVRIIFRGDSGFCRWRMLAWCERNDVGYIVGIARNDVLERRAEPWMDEARKEHEKTHLKVRQFSEFNYAAKSWDKPRRIILKAEYTLQGRNPRFVVTNLVGEPAKLYEKIFCARGNMENRIKEQQMDLFSDRTSAHRWWANQFRLLLSSLAYVLVESIRRIGLRSTELTSAVCGSIRLKLFKIGGFVIRNTRRVQFQLSSAYPFKDLFRLVARRLCAG